MGGRILPVLEFEMARLLQKVKGEPRQLAKISSHRNRQTLRTNRPAKKKIPTPHFQTMAPMLLEELRPTRQRMGTTRLPRVIQVRAIQKRQPPTPMALPSVPIRAA